jgi:hypothetical protein
MILASKSHAERLSPRISGDQLLVSRLLISEQEISCLAIAERLTEDIESPHPLVALSAHGKFNEKDGDIEHPLFAFGGVDTQDKEVQRVLGAIATDQLSCRDRLQDVWLPRMIKTVQCLVSRIAMLRKRFVDSS